MSSKKSPIESPTKSMKKSKARTLGISLLFSAREHEALRLVASRKKLSYSHTIRTLIVDEERRLWPDGVRAEDLRRLDAAETGKQAHVKRRMYDARKEKLDLVLKKEAELHKTRLLMQEEMRSLQRNNKKRPSPPKAPPALPPEPLSEALPAMAPNEAVAAWYAKRKADVERKDAVRAAKTPRVRSRLPAS